MEDKTIIRLAQLLTGAFTLLVHAHYGIDTILILMVCALWGIPLDIILRKKGNKNE